MTLLLCAAPAAARSPWGDCAGQVILLGTTSQAEGAGFAYWAALSNPGMRPVLVAARLGVDAALPPLRIEAGRMHRLRLGAGTTALAPDEIAGRLHLACQRIATQP